LVGFGLVTPLLADGNRIGGRPAKMIANLPEVSKILGRLLLQNPSLKQNGLATMETAR